MINKITHIADLHWRLFKRHDEFKEQFEKFFELQRKEKPDRIVIVGDIVHSKTTVSPELVRMVQWCLSECAKIAKTIITPGNHDFLENNMDRLDTLTPIIEGLDNDNIVYLKDTGCYEDENVVWCVYSLFQHNERPDIEEAQEEFGEDKKYIGLFHSPLQGSSTDLGFEFDEAYELNQFTNTDYTLCGDIHKRQEFKTPEGRPIIMVGSTIQQNISETVTKHGYCTIDLVKDRYHFTDITSDHGHYDFKIKSIEDIDNDKEVLMNY